MSMEFSSIANALLWTNVRVIVLIAVVSLSLILVQRQASAYRHNLWLVVIAGCLALPFISGWIPALQLPVPFDGLLPQLIPNASTVAFAAPEALPVESGPVAVGPTEWLVFLYAFGALGLLGYFGMAFVRLALAEKRMTQWSDPVAVELLDNLSRDFDVRRRISLLCDNSAKSPFTWGVIRPRIVLPAEAAAWPVERVSNVLLHELGHIRRFDWLRLIVQRFALAAYWFNPLVWIAVARCRYEAERACDDFVIESGGNSAEYAEQLVDLMAEGRASTSAAMALGHGHFSRRIRAILNSSTEDPVMNKLTTRFVAVVTPIFILLLAACQVTSGQPVEAEQARIAEESRTTEEAIQRAAIAAQREAVIQAEQRIADAQRAEQRGEQAAARAAERGAQAARQAAEQGAAQAAQAAEQGAQAARQAAEQGAQAARQAAEQRAVMAERLQRLELLNNDSTIVALDERLVDLQETQLRLADQERRLRQLEVELERRTVQLVELERTLVERDLELARTRQSAEPVEPID